jgi:hypothetical protein
VTFYVIHFGAYDQYSNTAMLASDLYFKTTAHTESNHILGKIHGCLTAAWNIFHTLAD